MYILIKIWILKHINLRIIDSAEKLMLQIGTSFFSYKFYFVEMSLVTFVIVTFVVVIVVYQFFVVFD